MGGREHDTLVQVLPEKRRRDGPEHFSRQQETRASALSCLQNNTISSPARLSQCTAHYGYGNGRGAGGQKINTNVKMVTPLIPCLESNINLPPPQMHTPFWFKFTPVNSRCQGMHYL